MCYQFHLRGGPGLCADGSWGPAGAAAAGWLARRRRAVLPWGVNFQHVCNEPGALPDVSGGQKSRVVEPPSTYSFHFVTGKRHLPSTADLKEAATLSRSFLFFSLSLRPPRAITLWRKERPFLALGQITSSLWKWMMGNVSLVFTGDKTTA